MRPGRGARAAPPSDQPQNAYRRPGPRRPALDRRRGDRGDGSGDHRAPNGALGRTRSRRSRSPRTEARSRTRAGAGSRRSAPGARQARGVGGRDAAARGGRARRARGAERPAGPRRASAGWAPRGSGRGSPATSSDHDSAEAGSTPCCGVGRSGRRSGSARRRASAGPAAGAARLTAGGARPAARRPRAGGGGGGRRGRLGLRGGRRRRPPGARGGGARARAEADAADRPAVEVDVDEVALRGRSPGRRGWRRPGTNGSRRAGVGQAARAALHRPHAVAHVVGDEQRAVVVGRVGAAARGREGQARQRGARRRGRTRPRPGRRGGRRRTAP